MVTIGKRNTLTVLHEASPGFYLDGDQLGEILLPGTFRTPDIVPERSVDVFVYLDSKDRLVATTETPHVQVGEFAFLRVVSVDQNLGAFLDWGLSKDLFLPRREWAGPLKVGDWVVVHAHMDDRSNRIVASARVNRFLDLTPADYADRQPVRLLIAGQSPLGYLAIIDHQHRGLLYADDVPATLAIGQSFDGWILRTRMDGKIDVTLNEAGFDRIGPIAQKIVLELARADGHLPYHDRSDPAEIRDMFGVSKKAFKQAIGKLYAERRIVIESDGIRLLAPPPRA
ncbi:CvfB family protein [Synoicihabitans lomoniglobus]|uniref:S1-like domain-containing RNA-binding protein n=1 Tax=Synoicihabitans lomoniglobus TaxID=2909285 RepID=A0AAF0CPH5_9BACT|nr:S1-like domain-containing RNA-binding protein [Opitutaceae bacterium LMO-M01]WED64774.1 S1-like domain-containing RNA-binding protein [Opitutaceae bacterium LMO-M01]